MCLTDWFRIIADLDRAGVPNAKLAKLLGHSESTVNRWKQGSEPKHSDGELIIALHHQLCANLPKTESDCA